MESAFALYGKKKLEESLVDYHKAVDNLRELLLEESNQQLRSQLEDRLNHCQRHADHIHNKYVFLAG